MDPIIGTPIEAVGSPFGLTSPAIFLNSHTQGIISNHIRQTPHNGPADVYLVDTRVVPGQEGGGLFDLSGRLLGMLLPPIRSRSDYIAFNFALPMRHIWDALENPSLNPPLSSPLSLPLPTQQANIALEKAMRSLVLLKCGTSWTSGFIYHKDGFVITNAHLFGTTAQRAEAKSASVKVRIDYPR